MTTNYIGQPVSRVDGYAKVTGAAKYAAEHNVPDLAYGFVVSSTIAKGKITRIDTSQALRLDGVLQVFTHENAPPASKLDKSFQDEVAPPGSPFRPLQDDRSVSAGNLSPWRSQRLSTLRDMLRPGSRGIRAGAA